MRKGIMNFTVEDIEMFIEIGQVGLHSPENKATLWLHSGLTESKEVICFTECCGIVLCFQLLGHIKLYNCCVILKCIILLFNQLLVREAVVLIVWSMLHC